MAVTRAFIEGAMTCIFIYSFSALLISFEMNLKKTTSDFKLVVQNTD